MFLTSPKQFRNPENGNGRLPSTHRQKIWEKMNRVRQGQKELAFNPSAFVTFFAAVGVSSQSSTIVV
jgi:hypothetical protein